MSRSSEEEELLRSFLEELDRAQPNLQTFLFIPPGIEEAPKRGPPRASGERLPQQQQQQQLGYQTAQQTAWTADALQGALKDLSALQLSEEGPPPGTPPPPPPEALFAPAPTPGLVFSALDALVRLLIRLLPLADPEINGAPSGARPQPPTSPPPARCQHERRRRALAESLLELTLACLANLLESPSWRHVFFRVLHEAQLEQQQRQQRQQQQQQLRAFGGGGGGRGDGGKPSVAASMTTLQEHLWRRIVADAPAPAPAGGAAKPGVDAPSATPAASQRPVVAVDCAAVRVCCSMVRHRPLSFSASSYASLAPFLVGYLLDGRGNGAGGATADSKKNNNNRNSSSTGCKDTDGAAARGELVVLLDLFAACARGSPHFRQYVKGLRRKRELFRRLLGLLGPRCDGEIVVRALCALTRVLAGDPLEGKVFDRGNALETASLVMDNLLDLSGCSGERVGGAGGGSKPAAISPDQGGSCGGGGGSSLEEQRRYADVASDLARSRVFTSVLLDTGRLATFLREAVAVLVKAAEDVAGDLSTEDARVAREGGGGGGGGGGRGAGRDGSASLLFAGRGTSRRRGNRRGGTRPEPLLRALCSFCLEHSPARATFIQALLDGSDGGDGKGTLSASEAADDDGGGNKGARAADPCAALFALCLHPHLPSAAAASTLLQCLLVGGGALGAVSGPSAGAAAGVGVIPAGFVLTPTGGCGCGGEGGGGGSAGAGAGAAGIGREDPLQAALLERIGAVALGGTVAGGHRRQRRQPRSPGRSGDDLHRGGLRWESRAAGGGGHARGDADSSSSDGGDDDDVYDDSAADDDWVGLEALGGVAGAAAPPGGSSALASPSTPPGALTHLILRLRQVGADLASAHAKQQLGSAGGAGSGRGSLGAAGSPLRAPCAARGEGGGGLKALAVERELELTSILCLLSSLTLAVPPAGRALARALPLEAAFVPILAAQRGVLGGVDPADYPRAPVEIVLVSVTLVAQLGVELVRSSGGGGGGGGSAAVGEASAERERRRAGAQRRRGRRDAARAARLRGFLGEQAAAGEVKLCLGHAACRAESKDLARRASALISLLQAGGGADALLVADSLYAFAQSAEAREADLRSRAAAAESAVCRERAAGARRAAALEEAEGLVSQIEARNTEDLRRLSDQESSARRRIEEAHARALTRAEVSLRRSEETVGDLERVLQSKEDALRCAGREGRAKDLEIASLKGDLAGEQRLRAAIDAKLEEASSKRDELFRGKSEAESILAATKEELSSALEQGASNEKGWQVERDSAAKGWAAAKDAEEELERANGRTEEAYGKLILLARGYKTLEEESRGKAVETARLLVEAETQNKLLKDQAREEQRRHRLTKAAVQDGEEALQRAEQRLTKVSVEAAEAQAAAVAARAAGRELVEKAAASAREAALRRDEALTLKGELERARAACAEKDLELANKSQELGQQAGIIDYINKLSRNAAAGAAATSCAAEIGADGFASDNGNGGGSKTAGSQIVSARTVTVEGDGGKVARVPDHSDGKGVHHAV